MDRERLRRQLEIAKALREEKAAALERAQARHPRAAGSEGAAARLRLELRHADARVAALTNAISTLERIGEQTTRHYHAKRHAAR